MDYKRTPIIRGEKEIIKRVATTSNSKQTIEFDKVGVEFLVKNFTNGDIFVSLSDDIKDTSTAYKIPSNTAQTCFIDASYLYGTNVVTILPTMTSALASGVEIQMTRRKVGE